MRHFIPILATATRFGMPDEAGRSWVENRHGGWIMAVDAQKGVLFATPGAHEAACFIRSAAKPFQALPLVRQGFHADLTPEELALACASHAASCEHLRIVAELLRKADLPESALGCGPHPPGDPATARALVAIQQSPRAIHNNCSGKHAAMLYYCRRAGLETDTYLHPAHPLQQAILAGIREYGDIGDVPLSVDGCGAPVFYLPLSVMALMYARLGVSPECRPLVEAMSMHPRLVGGEGRIDTLLMEVSDGRLLAKVGAEGLLGVSRVGSGEGLVVKIADGASDIRAVVAVQALIRLGWLTAGMAEDPRLQPYVQPARLNTLGQTVGTITVYWPDEEETAHAGMGTAAGNPLAR